MIRISKMADYSVVILCALAREPKAMMSATMIAQDTMLPEPTVSKILKLLSKAQIVRATRGTNGGYHLADAPKDITVARVIAAVDGPIAITACADGNEPDCSLTTLCAVRGRWDGVNQEIIKALENVSLFDMVAKPARQGMKIQDKVEGKYADGRH